MQEATISFVMSVRLSIRNNSALTGRMFLKFDVWVFFETRQNLILINISMKTYAHLWYLDELFLEREMFDNL
jgi:hypothetical protein